MGEHEDVVTDLDEDACWRMLASHEFGHLAFHLLDEVHLVPINYAVNGHRLVFRTSEGSKLLGITMNTDVAFEVDEYDEEHATSVVVRGQARQLHGTEADVVDQLPLRPWVPTAKFNVMEVEPSHVSGRSFRLDRPWLHMIPHRGGHANAW